MTLATNPNEVAALSNRVRNISRAAEAYGLIERRFRPSGSIAIRGTDLLHKFMTRLGSETVRAVRESSQEWNLRQGGDFEDWIIPETDVEPAGRLEKAEAGWLSEVATAADALGSGIVEILAMAQRAAAIANERGNEIDAVLEAIHKVEASKEVDGPATK